MVLPMATGTMLRHMYWPTDTGAPFFIPNGTCRCRHELSDISYQNGSQVNLKLDLHSTGFRSWGRPDAQGTQLKGG